MAIAERLAQVGEEIHHVENDLRESRLEVFFLARG